MVIALMLHGCGESGSEEKVTGVGLLSGEGEHQTTTNSFSAGATKPFPKLTPTYPSMDNLNGHPQTFPAVYPVSAYPGGKVALVRIEAKQAPGVMNQVMLSSADPPYIVDRYYAARLIKDGWTKTHEFENSAFGTSTWQKDGQQVEVRVSPDPHGAQSIQLFWGMAPRTPRNPVSQQRSNNS
jgi:hypothetical protein